MVKIYLDDVREPYDQSWTLIRTFSDFIDFVASHPSEITEISFDHDLGVDEFDVLLPTGYDAAKWFIEWVQFESMTAENLKTVIVHSSNPPGAENIRSLFRSAAIHGVLPVNLEVR